MNLRKCIEVLREIQSASNGLVTPGGPAGRTVVPYRDKRLTHLFKNFFEGDGRVVMLVCIHQTIEDYDETMVSKYINTCRLMMPCHRDFSVKHCCSGEAQHIALLVIWDVSMVAVVSCTALAIDRIGQAGTCGLIIVPTFTHFSCEHCGFII